MPELSHPPAQLLIDGRLRPASDGATFDDINPATEQVIGVARGDRSDFDAALAAARRRSTPPMEQRPELRVHCLRQLHAALVAHGAGCAS